MPKKEQSEKHAAIPAVVGKTLTSIDVWRSGSVDVIEIAYTGGPTFIKVRQGQIETGGDANWGTGTIL